VSEQGEVFRKASGQIGRPDKPELVLVWDWPLRLWHWALAVFVSVAWFTPNQYDSLHRFAGYVVIGLLVFRLGWAGAAMMVALLSLLTISTITGAMHVTVRFFGVWWVEDTHTYSSYAVMILVLLHVTGTVVTSVLQRENLIAAMFTGRKRRRTGE
jgi:cytochrome b